MKHRKSRFAVALGLAIAAAAHAQQPIRPQAVSPPSQNDADPELGFHHALVIGPVGPMQRAVLLPDPIAGAWVRDAMVPPKEGQTVTLGDGTTRAWRAADFDADTVLKADDLRGGYAFAPFKLADRDVLLIQVDGSSMIYVNGEPHAGDPYKTGSVRQPVVVNAGWNQLLVKCGANEIKVRLRAPLAPTYIDPADATLPDVIGGQAGRLLGAVLVVNATEEWQKDLLISAAMPGGGLRQTSVEPIPPLTTVKVPFDFDVPASVSGSSAKLDLTLTHAAGAGVTTQCTVGLRVRQPLETCKLTFRSQIDGSVQYYAVRAAGPEAEANPGMIFTLHGASVEASGQADAYANKPWATIVAPTNRRPYGFDWEDIGRMDFLEVYSDAMTRFRPDPARVYLTGHSMGGHGTWQIGAQYPAGFAAIAPSAGWISFQSYTGAAAYDSGSPIENILRRAGSPSDTLALKGNYNGVGVYVLHGDADDNVPVDQARRMKQEVGAIHPDFEYFEKAGAGHWWGNECVDWPPLMEFLKKHSRADRGSVPRTVFTTASPGVSSSPCGWASVEAQLEPLKPSTVDLSADASSRTISGTTKNVARLVIGTTALGAGDGPVHLKLDGQSLDAKADGSSLHVSRKGDAWSVTPMPTGMVKSPVRSGLFKDIFRSGVIFVVGTHGSPEENAWALQRAKFDAETFLYRGNGSPRIILDTEFNAASFVDRNVLLYGNSQTNSAWPALLGQRGPEVVHGRFTLGGHTITGEDIACLFIQPRADSASACVGAVTGTGVTGMRLTSRIPYFQSGVGVPDWIVLGAEACERGVGGIRSVGFFDNEWGYSEANSAWRDDAAH